MFLRIFFTFLLAFFLALRVLLGVSFLELADFQSDLVALDAQTGGQLGIATLGLGRCIQHLVGVVRFQGASHFVAFRLLGQSWCLAALDLGLEVVSRRVSFQASDEAVAIARVLIHGDAILEGEFLLGFALGFR